VIKTFDVLSINVTREFANGESYAAWGCAKIFCSVYVRRVWLFHEVFAQNNNKVAAFCISNLLLL
jgi:hypothetical protein